MNQMMVARDAVAKLKETTGLQDDNELAKKLGIPATAIKIYQHGNFENTRAYKTLVQGAIKNLGVTEEFFYEGDPSWTPAKPAAKVEVADGKAVKPEPETKAAEEKTVVEPVKEEVKPEPAKAEAPKPAPVKTEAKPAAVASSDYSEFVEQAVKMLKAGMSRKEICQALNVGKTTFYKYLKLAGVDVSTVATAAAPVKAAPVVAEAPAEEPVVPVINEAEETEEVVEPVAEPETEIVAEEEPKAAIEEAVEDAASVTEAPAEEPVAEPETVEAEKPAVTLEQAVEDKEPVVTKTSATTSFADTVAKFIASDIEKAIAEATKKASDRAEKLTALVEKAAALPDGLLDALVAIANSMK